jgi:hypothetical protein
MARKRLSAYLRVIVLFLLVTSPAVVTQALAPASVAASTVSVSGFVFRDLDNDGVRDASEPGVPGVPVHRSNGDGTPTTTTNADGSYTLTGLKAGSSGFIRIETGWFRSQCAKLTCQAGPGPDNDFQVDNQFIRYPLSRVNGNTTNLNVGLLPDWPGSASGPPAPVNGVVPANNVDVAARLSWLNGTCAAGKLQICRVGDTYSVVGQIFNQGTTTLTGIAFALRLPTSDRLSTGDLSRDVTIVWPSTSPAITGRTVTAPDGQNTINVTLVGSLPPGGAALVRVNGRVVGGPGTAGCIVGAVTKACPTKEPQGAPLIISVTHVDQSGDPDSFGPDCPPGQAVALCGTGIHDKQVQPDQVDPAGHNVVAGAGTSSVYNLTSSLLPLTPSTPPGGPLSWRAIAFNTGPATVAPGWTLTVILPMNTSPVVPAGNALRSCAKGKTSAGYPFVRCTGKGPLSPGVSSIAVDVSATAPGSTKPGTNLSAVAYVTPPSGQGPETVPLGTPPTNPGVDTTKTSTDNDSSAAVAVQSR